MVYNPSRARSKFIKSFLEGYWSCRLQSCLKRKGEGKKKKWQKKKQGVRWEEDLKKIKSRMEIKKAFLKKYQSLNTPCYNALFKVNGTYWRLIYWLSEATATHGNDIWENWKRIWFKLHWQAAMTIASIWNKAVKL